MKLYYAPHTRAGRIRWLLEELEVPYVLERLDFSKREHKSLDYLKIHPHGSVPALVDGSLAMFESAAITLYLVDKYPERRLAPPVGTPERGYFYQWVVYPVATMEPPMMQYLMHARILPEDQRIPRIAEKARAEFGEPLKVLEQELRGKSFILGEHFSAADVMIGSALQFAQFLGLVDERPEISAYMTRLTDRPASKRSQADD